MSVLLDLIVKRTEVAGEAIELPDPGSDVEPNEEVVGEITDSRLRRLFYLHTELASEANAVVRKSVVEVAPIFGKVLRGKQAAINPFLDKAMSLDVLVRFSQEKSDAVSKLFWAAVKAELSYQVLSRINRPDCPGMALRKGWKLVALPAADEECE